MLKQWKASINFFHTSFINFYIQIFKILRLVRLMAHLFMYLWMLKIFCFYYYYCFKLSRIILLQFAFNVLAAVTEKGPN